MRNEMLPDHDVVVLSRIRLSRNYSDLPFSPGLDKEGAQTVLARAKQALSEEDLSYYRLSDMADYARRHLLEHRLISYDLLKFQERAQALISYDESMTVMIGENDHLRIQGQYPALQLERAAERAFAAEELLSQQALFAFDERWGYLTACPTDVGTGLRASVLLHLPALSEAKQINAIGQALSKLGLSVRPSYGENSDTAGSLYLLANQVTLGRTEEDIIRSVMAATRQVAGHERQLRQQLLDQDREALTDRLMRSAGILMNARLLSTHEWMERYSDLRLAAEIDLIDIPMLEIDRMMMKMCGGSLQVGAGRELTDREQEQIRAQSLRERLRELRAPIGGV